MLSFAGRRALQVVPLLLFVSLLIFALIHVADKARGGYRVEQITAAHH